MKTGRDQTSRKWRKGRRGKPRLRWEDCVKREAKEVGGEWRTAAQDRRSWRLLTENVVRLKLKKEKTKKRTTVALTNRDAAKRRTTKLVSPSFGHASINKQSRHTTDMFFS